MYTYVYVYIYIYIHINIYTYHVMILARILLFVRGVALSYVLGQIVGLLMSSAVYMVAFAYAGCRYATVLHSIWPLYHHALACSLSIIWTRGS